MMIASILRARGYKRSLVRLIPTNPVRKASTCPIEIKPSIHEVTSNRLDDRRLEKAVRSLHEDGLVVIKDLIDHDRLDRLNTKMVQDARTLQARGKDGPFNYNQSNLQQDPPPIASYFHPSIFLNPIASQITTAMMGPKPKWTFCSGNSAMPPGSDSRPQRQPVHSDADFAHPMHPFAFVVNVPLIDMTSDNGSTEVWLGTHLTSNLQVQEGKHGDRASGRIKEDLLRLRRDVRGPCQPTIEKGSIVIRDLRLWHAGMPNFSDEIRVMLAMIHFAPWYRNPMKLELGNSIKDMIREQTMLQTPVTWVTDAEAEERYLNRGFGNFYDFNQEQ